MRQFKNKSRQLPCIALNQELQVNTTDVEQINAFTELRQSRQFKESKNDA